MTAADIGAVALPAEARIHVVIDARECPFCLQERVAAADAILNRIFILKPSMDRETFKLLHDYIVRYDP